MYKNIFYGNINILKRKEYILLDTEMWQKGGVFMKIIDKAALILIIVGAINWGLIGFFKFDLVAAIFGQMSVLSRIIYALVGISGLWGIKLLFED